MSLRSTPMAKAKHAAAIASSNGSGHVTMFGQMRAEGVSKSDDDATGSRPDSRLGAASTTSRLQISHTSFVLLSPQLPLAHKSRRY